MTKIAHIPGAKLFIGKILDQRSNVEQLGGNYVTVAELVGIITAREPNGLPNHWIRVVNIVLQFIEPTESRDSGGSGDCGVQPVPRAGQEASLVPIPEASSLSLYYIDSKIILSGDPTGSVLFIMGPDNSDNPDVTVLSGNTYTVLNVAVTVINGKLFLQSVRGTKFVACGHPKGFINLQNFVTKSWSLVAA